MPSEPVSVNEPVCVCGHAKLSHKHVDSYFITGPFSYCWECSMHGNDCRCFVAMRATQCERCGGNGPARFTKLGGNAMPDRYALTEVQTDAQ
jgi:hypothetical protein